MSIRRYALVLGLIALCQGCDLAVNFTRNVIFEVQRCTDDCREHIRNRRLANLAWNEAQDCVPMGPFRPDYARGFKDGYADYLYAGGECDPPFLPPRHYWGMRYETPQGFQAIQDWYAGYRHGRAAAQLSGYRQFVMIPFPMSEPGCVPYPPSLSVFETPAPLTPAFTVPRSDKALSAFEELSRPRAVP